MLKRSSAAAYTRGALLLSILTLTSSVCPLPTPVETPKLAPHRGDLESAAKEALERNAPMIIHIILEGEERNDAYRDEILTNKDLIKISEACVVVIGNNGEHKQKTIKEKTDGVSTERTVCSAYPMFANCDGHRKIWDPLYHEYQDEDGEMGCPQTILLSPSGEIEWRHNVRDPPTSSEVQSAIKASQKKHGQSLTATGLRTIKGHAVAAKNAEGAKKWALAWTRYQGILDLISVGKWAEIAKPGKERAAKAISKKLTSLEARFIPGAVDAPWRELIALLESTKGTPFTREVSAMKKKIERDKSLKDELSKIRKEMEAESIWDDADALLRRGEERKAMKLLKKLTGKKFAGTKVQALVKERFPELG